MSLNPTQLQALKTELTTDPRSYGYAADLASGNDAGLVNKLNLARTGSNGGPLIRLNNAAVDTGAIRAAITKAAYDGLTTGDRTWMNWLTGAGTIVVNIDNLQTLAGIPHRQRVRLVHRNSDGHERGDGSHPEVYRQPSAGTVRRAGV